MLALDEAGNESAPSNEVSATPQDEDPPEPPVLVSPATAAMPYETTETPQNIRAQAEPGVLVRLLRDGAHVAETRALGQALVTPLALSDTAQIAPSGRHALDASSGQLEWIDLDTGQMRVVLESLSGAFAFLGEREAIVASSDGRIERLALDQAGSRRF